MKITIKSSSGASATGKLKYFDDWDRTIKGLISEEEIQSIADGAVSAMRSKLNSSITRQPNTDNLSDLLSVDYVKNNKGFSFRIGDTDKLNDEETGAPYWYVINYGHMYGGGEYIPPKRIGSFYGSPSEPTAGAGGQLWQTGIAGLNDKMYFMNPQKPIAGKHYIEAGVNYINKALAKYFDKRTYAYKSLYGKSTKKKK